MSLVLQSSPKQLGLAQLLTPEALRQSALWCHKHYSGPGRADLEALVANLDGHIPLLQQQVLSGAYQPKPAQRFYIAKDKGGERAVVSQLWIDRVVQGAVRRVLTPYFDPRLSEASFAYSEGKGAVRAAHRIVQHRDAGRVWVLRGDIHQFFASVPHNLMLQALQPHLSSEALQWMQTVLRHPVRDGQVVTATEVGLLEGGVMSPLLANIYLHPFDQALSQAPAGLVRFADDFTLLAFSAKEVGEKLEQAQQQLTRLQLRLSASKTRILSFDQGFDFLGFRFEGRSVRVSPDRVDEFKAHLSHLLNPRFGSGSKAAVRQANDLIRGWRNYFRLGEVATDFLALEQWLHDRFGSIAHQLERLVPEASVRKPPVLGGYEHRLRRKPKTTAAPATQASPSGVTRDQSGKPLLVLRNQRWLEVMGLPALAHSVSNTLLAQLRSVGLYHRAGVCGQWSLEVATQAVSLCAAALGKRATWTQAHQAYDTALAAKAQCDVRSYRGMVRRALRMEFWAVLLAQGLDIGPDSGGIPHLVLAWTEAYEPVLSDHALLQAFKTQQNPLRVLEFTLDKAVVYRAQRLAWRVVLQQEAQHLMAALAGHGYRPFMWGQP